jgi:hypothetical protein
MLIVQSPKMEYSTQIVKKQSGVRVIEPIVSSTRLKSKIITNAPNMQMKVDRLNFLLMKEKNQRIIKRKLLEEFKNTYSPKIYEPTLREIVFASEKTKDYYRKLMPMIKKNRNIKYLENKELHDSLITELETEFNIRTKYLENVEFEQRRRHRKMLSEIKGECSGCAYLSDKGVEQKENHKKMIAEFKDTHKPYEPKQKAQKSPQQVIKKIESFVKVMTTVKLTADPSIVYSATPDFNDGEIIFPEPFNVVLQIGQRFKFSPELDVICALGKVGTKIPPYEIMVPAGVKYYKRESHGVFKLTQCDQLYCFEEDAMVIIPGGTYFNNGLHCYSTVNDTPIYLVN